MSDIHSELEFALDAIYAAGRITLGYFQTDLEPEMKSDHTPVTLADKAAEKYLRETITRYYPDDSIIGEEFGTHEGKSGRTWIIDPIDGTKSFVAGVPLYGCLLALVDAEKPIVGIAHFPALNETVYASQGNGCYWNGRRAHVSSVDALKNAVLLFSDVSGYDARKREAWQNLIDATYIQRTWGDAYGYSLIATGRADIMIDAKMALWDSAPFGIILEEAGGTFTDWNGTSTIHQPEGIATNGALFDSVMAFTRERNAGS